MITDETSHNKGKFVVLDLHKIMPNNTLAHSDNMRQSASDNSASFTSNAVGGGMGE